MTTPFVETGRRRFAAPLLALALVVACGDATPAATSVAPTGATTTAASPAPTTTAPREVWQLVWISDSMGSGGAARAYGAIIEEELGVEVEVTDLWSGGLTADYLRRVLQGEGGGMFGTMEHAPVNVLQLIAEAEVIVVNGNPTGLDTGDWNCAIDRALGRPCGETTGICGAETWTPYEDALGEIYDTVFELRDGAPVILRTFNWYLPPGPLASWRECDREAVCKRCWGEFSAAVHRAAAAHGVPVADLLLAFNGELLERDLPITFMRDDVHPSAEGAALIARVMADLGYELVYPLP